MLGTPLKTCDNCLAGKTHRISFHTRPPFRKSNVIDLIHTDVCTMQTRTLGGTLYFITFIDDHSRKVWVFALKSKDQVLDAFKELHARIERETGRKVKYVRVDNVASVRVHLNTVVDSMESSLRSQFQKLFNVMVWQKE